MTNPHASAVQRAVFGGGPAKPVNLKSQHPPAVIASDDRRQKRLADALKRQIKTMAAELLAWRSADSMGIVPNTPAAQVYLQRARQLWAANPALEHVPARDAEGADANPAE